MTQHLITRDEWGAVEQDGTGDRPLPIKEWWAHHSVTIAPDLLPPFTDDDAAVRTLERIGEQRFSTGISYTFPVTPVGRCYQGHSMHRIGSHTRGHNTIGAAIVFVGDYSTKQPTAAAQEAASRRMVIEHRAGRAQTHRFDGGHTEASSPDGGTANTACPGAGVLAAIPSMNARADALWASGYPNTSPEEDDIMAMTAAEQDAFAQKIADKVLWAKAIPGGGGMGGSSVRNNIGVTGNAAQTLLAQVAALSAVVSQLAAAQPGQTLTAEEIVAAAKAGASEALDERISDADVRLEVKQ